MKKRNWNELIGQKFNHLTVTGISYEPREGHGVRANFIYKCECGNTGRTDAARVLSERTISCGCMRGTKPGANIPRAIKKFGYGILRRQAKDRGVPVGISFDEYVSLAEQPCHYDGTMPSNDLATQYRKKATDSAKKRSNRDFINPNFTGIRWMTSGLDRIDSDKGYTLDNVVPCCRNCNRAKSDLTLGTFDAWLQRAYNHRFGGRKTT
jgi:hypothetical protein